MTPDGRYTDIAEMPLLLTKEEVASFFTCEVKTIQNDPRAYGGRKLKKGGWRYPRDLVLLAARVPMGEYKDHIYSDDHGRSGRVFPHQVPDRTILPGQMRPQEKPAAGLRAYRSSAYKIAGVPVEAQS